MPLYRGEHQERLLYVMCKSFWSEERGKETKLRHFQQRVEDIPRRKAKRTDKF